ncbi:MAG: aminopeptidase N [Pseudomonadota bacterium]
MKKNNVTKYRKDYKPSYFLINQTDLDIDLYNEKALVKASLTITKNEQLSKLETSLTLHGEGLNLQSIAIDGQPLNEEDYQVTDENLVIHQLPNAQSFRLETTVEIQPHLNHSLEGLYLSNQKFCTQCEAEGFRKITYYLDRPDVLSIFTTRITADKKQFPYLLSNGNLKHFGDLDEHRHWAEWHDPYPKPSYLFALVAGDFDRLSDTYKTQSNRIVNLEFYVDKGKLNQCHYAMQSLKNAMQWDEERFGLEYDLDMYMIVAVGDFNMGAMENKGLNIFNTKYVLASQETATDSDFEGVESVIGHEYFHNWTGNRVTCRDWFQLSLKEGLTVFRDQEFTADLRARSVKRIDDAALIQSAQFAEDAGPMSHPIRPDSYIEMNNFYTVTVYDKGAEVIRMMHTLLGEKNFRAGMDCYFERHDGQAVTCEDFILAMESASGYDLQQFRRWYSQAGTPSVKVADHYNPEEQTYSLHIKQSCSSRSGEGPKKPFHIPIKLGFIDQEGHSVPLMIKGDDNQLDGDILHVREESMKVIFSGVENKPTPSLLRDFSAPVKLEYDYSNEQLAFLISHDSNEYNRWSATQQLLSRNLFEAVDEENTQNEITLDPLLVDALHALLDDQDIDLALKSRALLLPSYSALMEMRERIDVDKMVTYHQLLTELIAKAFESTFKMHYEREVNQSERLQEKEAIASRAYRNVCLHYLTQLDNDKYIDIAKQQYASAQNMTDRLAAFKAVVFSDYDDKTAIIEDFYHQWKHEALVIDKWLSIQAMSMSWGDLSKIIELTQHSAYEAKNPNKIRSLIGAFASQNFKHFHRIDGKAYDWFTQQILAIDEFNPQIAARLVSQYNRWKKYDDMRQSLIKTQLDKLLANDHLSKDTFEIVTKARNA